MGRISTVLLGAVLAASAAYGAVVERIVAKVNEEIVTLYDVERRKDDLAAEFRRAGKAVPATLAQDALDQCINELLIAQLAKKEGVTVGRLELDENVERIAKGNNLTIEQFKAELTKAGMSYERYVEQMRHKRLLQKLFQKTQKDGALQPSDKEIKEFYDSNKGKEDLQQPKVVHCYIRVNPYASFSERNAAEARIGRIEQALKKNPWAIYQVGPANADLFKDHGFLKRERDLPVYLQVSLPWMMRAGEYKDGRTVNEIPNFPGYHAWFVPEKRALPLADVKAAIANLLAEQRMGKALDEWVTTLRKSAVITVNK